MAAEYSANAEQLVAANGNVIFTESPVPCNRGLIYHRDESGVFRLASPRLINGVRRGGCCCNLPEAIYQVSFSANIAVPEDPAGTVGEISLALALDGAVDPSSTMRFTPAAVGDYGSVSTAILVSVPWICGCESVSVVNTSDQAINVQNANIVFNFVGIRR